MNEVRTNGRTLREAINSHASWVHNWTFFNSAAFAEKNRSNAARPRVADINGDTVLEMKRAQELARSDQSERDCLYNLQASMSCSSGGVRVVAK